jgi:hypothetical protein
MIGAQLLIVSSPLDLARSHLSNSNYAQAGDFARMQYACDFIGVPYAQDGIMTLLGGA